MNKQRIVAVAAVALLLGAAASYAAEKSGEALFKEHCVMCHVDGGNIVNPKKTLKRKDLAANNIKTADDIIRVIRKPGPGMTPFDEKAIPQKDAKKIADYIFKKFQ